ncbi:glycosyltransferase [Mycobacterium sp. 1164985.4]|uniref:glycosyltransferase n=1 Tax=Mycobacterium sp. 1164985.4 TaxID=1834069 RepID=UPI0007FBA8C1|nr:glycosyltransferase [Mycobacterium sp. 1164985.4]OBK73778.1 glycosyl transferase family 1 [Mycobacterium sp. 1164985.4]
MKFLMATNWTRGDVEPFAAVGRELLSRGHEVLLAIPPDLRGFVEAAGLPAVACGAETQAVIEATWKFNRSFRSPWQIQEIIRSGREYDELLFESWHETATTLASIVDGADLLVTRGGYPSAVNVAEAYRIPLATLYTFPLRPNGRLFPLLPTPVARSAMQAYEWLYWWRALKKFDDAQRRLLALPRATAPAPQRIAALEIQSYDEVCFPGLAAEWNDQRPFVGALTMDLPTESDEEVMSWIAEGTPPIFFGFGSSPVESPAETLAMIGAACARLGERALVCSPNTDLGDAPNFEHVKVVRAMNYTAAFPACRAVVHHGGTGTTAAGLRAGVPTLILWIADTQRYMGAAVKRLKVGTARSFSNATEKSLVADLRKILATHYVTRAREIATRMTKPAESSAAAADLLESYALVQRVESSAKGRPAE